MIKTLTIALIVMLMASCVSPSSSLKTRRGDLELIDNVQVKFNVILYGDEQDAMRMVVLDLQNDEFEITPHAPDFAFNLQQDVEPGEALKQAREFLVNHSLVVGIEARVIYEPGGAIVAYELKPEYVAMSEYYHSTARTNYYMHKNKQNIIMFTVKQSITAEEFRSIKGSDKY